jgi:hypothetical protein
MQPSDALTRKVYALKAMRAVVIGLAVALIGSAASVAAPSKSQRYVGWRYGPISGTSTLTITSPHLTCPGNNRDERRLIRAIYRLSFTGTSMRHTRAAADIGYNLAAGGPAGNTEPIALRLRRSADELVHVRTITFDDLGNPVCTLEERPCSLSDTKQVRSASQRLNIRMRRGGYVHIFPPSPFYFLECDRSVPDVDLLFYGGDVNGPRFRLGVFNRPRATLRLAADEPGGGATETGARVTARNVSRVSIGIVRLPGTPLARCKVC